MNTVTTDIRTACREDAEAIAEVHRASWLGAYNGVIPEPHLSQMIERRGIEWWRGAIGRGSSVLVASVGGKIRGYATIGRNRAAQLPQDGEIFELYIEPTYQGMGLGTRLFLAARKQLTASGLKRHVVWALEENEIALQFYGNLGGRDVAEGVERFGHRKVTKVAFVWNH